MTTRYGRRPCGLQAVLVAVALALGGWAGARLTGHLSCVVSRSTLVQLIGARPDLDERTPLVLGVDDFALRKGHVYGAILVDIQARRPVDMLPERSAESFRTWLDAHRRDRPDPRLHRRDVETRPGSLRRRLRSWTPGRE